MSHAQGILTETDKAYLRGEKEYEHRQSAANKRAEIRERVAAALDDFALLNEHWSDEEQRKVIDELDNPEAAGADIVEFLYHFLNTPATEAINMMDEDAVSRALRFRRSLRRGIHDGKKRFGHDPGMVQIDASTELFEVPTKSDLREELDAEDWRRANEHVRNAIDSSGDEVIDREEAAKLYHMSLHLGIEERLYDRRCRASSEIKRHDTPVAASGPRLEDPE